MILFRSVRSNGETLEENRIEEGKRRHLFRDDDERGGRAVAFVDTIRELLVQK